MATRRPHLFGTDGIRGAFGRPPLVRETVTRLGFHLARTLVAASPGTQAGDGRPQVVLGGDTRASTPELCSWLAAGLEAGGARPRFAGVLPTPGVAFLTRHLGAACGVAVSASHNPLPDNGIKLIDRRGFKWAPEAEAALEERLSQAAGALPPPGGALEVEPALADAYLHGLQGSLPPGRPLAGLSLAVDAAHGAAAPYAEDLFRELGAEIEILAADPDGTNINRRCGSTRPEDLAAATARGGHHLGLAFDGDADRVILADEEGRVRDGDAILYLWAGTLAAEGLLAPPRIVATTMSNLGLERALARRGVAVERCGVGDREVVATLLREGLTLGGEQSGHVVHLGLSTTGDGLLTALQIAHLVARAGRPLSRLLAGFQRFPQVLMNVPARRKPDLGSLPSVAAATRAIEAELGAEGRLVLRYSGTEPLARIMIEGPDQGTIEGMARELARSLEEALVGEESPA